MAYKLIASDCDGTLINSRLEITEKTKLAISRAVQKGVIVTLATGRPIQGTRLYSNVLSPDAPIITYNGAMIVTRDTNRILFAQNMLPESARELLHISREERTTAVVWAGGRLFSDEVSEQVVLYGQISGVAPERLNDEDAVLALGVSKILWYDTEARTEKFVRRFSLHAPEHVTVCTSTPNFLELFDDRTSKGAALEQVCRLYGIAAGEVVAVGDSFNDISMLDYAGLGVAMGNAPDAVKAHADFVTRSNEQDGLAYMLERFVL